MSPRQRNVLARWVSPCFKIASLTLLAAALTGCGGGSGGGGGAPQQQLQLSTTQLNITSPIGGTVAAQTVTGTVSGNPQTVYARVVATSNGIASISGPTIDGSSASIGVQVQQPGVIGHGTYTDTITVSACRDQNCSQHYAGSPTTIQVRYAVGLDTGGTTSIAAQAVEGAAAPARNVPLSYYAGTGSWIGSLALSSPSQTWLTLQPFSGSLPGSVAVTFRPFAAGTYTASVDLTATGAQTQTRSIPVTYEVLPLLTGTVPSSFEVTSNDSSQSRSIAIGTRDSNRNTAWTASTTTPWLQITNGSGNTGGASSVTLQLVASQLAHMRNGRYNGSVSIDPALDGTTTIEVPVELVLDRTFVNTVAPYLGAANRSAQVIITGQRFTDRPIQAVRFGTTDATSFQVNSATRLMATYPSLPAGRYSVSIRVDGAELGSVAELVLQNPFSYVSAGAAPPIQSAFSIFDPERHSCYFLSHTQISALRAGATSWTSQVATLPDVAGSLGATITTDGRELLVYRSNAMLHLDPDTLQETRRTPLPVSLSGNYVDNLARLDDGWVAYAKDGNVYRYEPWTGAITQIGGGASAIEQVFESRAGNRIPWRFASNISIYEIYDSAAGTSAPFFTQPTLVRISSDRFARRWAINPTATTFDTLILDGQGTEIGRINVFNSNDNVLSDDGRTLVVGYSLGGGSSGDRYDVIDLTPLDSGGIPTLRTTLTNVPNRTGGLYFTPHQDEVVSCGANTGATAIPP